jgi:hypothetical protein
MFLFQSQVKIALIFTWNWNALQADIREVTREGGQQKK